MEKERLTASLAGLILRSILAVPWLGNCLVGRQGHLGKWEARQSQGNSGQVEDGKCSLDRRCAVRSVQGGRPCPVVYR